jgi:ABC-type polysaccharide/polyol phosphate transport system ATPase subunit
MRFSGGCRIRWFITYDAGGRVSHQIEFDNVVQRFRIIRERPDTLREIFSKFFRRREPGFYDFEALKGVSFHIDSGESVGIIGRNGSGKSTVLKIIAGVYTPSSGTITVRGKVAALIELAAGFHPELTGRENIVLNGLLLGLTRREIREHEQAIIDFAGVGDFIDSPVKQYSSGMFMRLGFAIAVQVNPDILLMDEILAVGDAPFQLKCLERIDEFRSQGKTTVLVSHDMAAIRAHCHRVLLINEGRLVADGDTDEVIARYEELQRTLAGAATGKAPAD